MFSSSIDDLLLDGEEVKETVTPSRMDSTYLKRYGLAFAVSIGLLVLTVGANSILDVNMFLAAAAVLLPLLIAIEPELERKYAKYHFTDRRVIVEKGILNRKSYSIYYNDVTHLETEQAIQERVFGVTDMHLHAAGEQNQEIVLSGVKDAEKYRKIINQRS